MMQHKCCSPQRRLSQYRPPRLPTVTAHSSVNPRESKCLQFSTTTCKTQRVITEPSSMTFHPSAKVCSSACSVRTTSVSSGVQCVFFKVEQLCEHSVPNLLIDVVYLGVKCNTVQQHSSNGLRGSAHMLPAPHGLTLGTHPSTEKCLFLSLLVHYIL